MAVIKDVAKAAGLSVSVVSKYLNYPDHVREDTKRRVEAAIRQLNYIPSITARSMRTKRTQMIAIVVPDIMDAFYTDVFNSIKYYSLLKGYTPILYSIEDDIDVLKKYLGKISINYFDGLILCFLEEDDLLEIYDKMQSEIPIAMFSGNSYNRFTAVVTDVYEGSYIATKHLIEKGYDRIAFIGGPDKRKTTSEKYGGFYKAMTEAKLPIHEEYMYFGHYRYETGYDAAEKYFMLPNIPNGVFAANDVIAAGFMKYMISKKVRIPDDIGVVGFDNTQIANIYEPGITTISIPVKPMSREVVKQLINIIEKKEIKKHTTVFKNELIVRRSTDRCADTEL